MTNGDKRPLKNRWQFSDSECSCCIGNKPAKMSNIRRHASQSDLTKEVKTLLCRVASLDVNAVIWQVGFIDILKISLKCCTKLWWKSDN